MSTLGIIFPVLGYLSSVSVITLVFFYVSSHVFKFCEWHRIPLYYIFSNQIINLLDYYIIFGISDTLMLVLYSLIFGAFSIICGILKNKANENKFQ